MSRPKTPQELHAGLLRCIADQIALGVANLPPDALAYFLGDVREICREYDRARMLREATAAASVENE